MSDKYIDNGREHLMHMLRDELPVLRARAKVSQEELATKIGISRQTYSSIETGKKEMSWTVFLALVAVFNNDSRTRHLLESFDELSEKTVNEINF